MIARDALRERLLSETLTITFTKKDGTDRTMVCTLQPSCIIPYEKKTETVRLNTYDENSMTVWDVENNGFRKLLIDKIKEIS